MDALGFSQIAEAVHAHVDQFQAIGERARDQFRRRPRQEDLTTMGSRREASAAVECPPK